MSNLKYKHTAYTSAQWASLNPVIVENEIVIESDTKRTKIGNGISTYNELEYADANSVGNSLGSIKPTDAAPTPARNGNYTFSIGGNKPAWLTAEAGITTVKAGDGVAVVYTAPSGYSYTHVDMNLNINKEGLYPFSSGATFKNTTFPLEMATSFLVDIYLEGTRDAERRYSPATIRRNYIGQWEIQIFSEVIVTSGYPSQLTPVAAFYTTINPENGDDITTHVLSESNNSGITGKIAVRWGAIPTVASITNNWASPDFGYQLSNDIFNKDRSYYLKPNILKGISDISIASNNKVNTSDFAKGSIDVYQHPRGSSEFVGDSTYSQNALGVWCKPTSLTFNKIQIKAAVATSGNVYIKIYKGAIPSSEFLISGLTLLYETTQIWDTNTNNTRTIDIPTNLTIEPDEYVYILFSTLTSVEVILKTWSNNTNADRTYLLLKVSTDYANEFTGTWYKAGSTEYMQVDPILSLIPPFINSSDISSYLPMPRITIPSKIYAVVGTQLNLYYDALILGTDCGLKSPKEYSVEIFCSKGIQKERCYQLLAQSGDVGNYQMTINVYNSNHAIIETKTITLYVIPATAPLLDGEPTVMIGDSLMADGVMTSTVRDKFVALGSNVPVFKGFIGTSPNNHQGIGGWTFADYATAGPNYYKFNVSGITSISAGSIYSNNGSQFTIREANLIAGVGYIKGDRSSGTNSPLASGTLTRVSGSGDATLSYSSVVLEAGNPLWNPSTSALDIAYYRSNLGMGATKYKVVTIQLGINESFGAVKSEADRTAVITYAKAICAAFLADNSNTKIIIQLPSTDGNTKGGWGANYGASGYKSEYQMNIWRLRELIISNFDNSVYSANVEVGIAGLVIDRYYGYGRTTQAISARINTTEEVHVNALHPITEGYELMGDAYFAQILHLLQ